MKFGRRPPKNAPSLKLAGFLTGTVPAHPVSEDYLAQLHNWQMLGNDREGDCVSVTWSNERRMLTALLGGHENYPNINQVVALYRTQNPNFDPNGNPNTTGPGSPADGGMDIQTCLEYLHGTGGPDGVKAVAFAQVDYRNPDEVKAALAIFGCVWVGFNVQRANMQQFNAGRPWDYVPGSPIEGGHSVVVGGYLGQAGNDERFVTWAQETGFTDRFWASGLVEEAWVCVWPEHLGSRAFLQGVDLAALAADYQALTGQPLPLPTPPPPPGPAPDDADRALWAVAQHWTTERHSGEARHLDTALEAWAKAKGLGST